MALPAADLNVVAMNGVKPNLQRIQTGALALTDFQSVQIVSCAISQRSPLVQFFVIARGDDATVANQHWRSFHNGAFQQFAQLCKLTHFLAQHLHGGTVYTFQLRAQFR